MNQTYARKSTELEPKCAMDVRKSLLEEQMNLLHGSIATIGQQVEELRSKLRPISVERDYPTPVNKNEPRQPASLVVEDLRKCNEDLLSIREQLGRIYENVEV